MYTGSCTEQTKASSLVDKTKEDRDKETKLHQNQQSSGDLVK